MSRIFESCLKSLPHGCFDCVFNGECAEKQLYEKGRADAIDEVIKKLAESEDAILSDIQYYTLIELKEQNNGLQ